MYPRATRIRALRLLDAGWSLNAVSKELGVSRAALREWRDNGVDPRRAVAPCFVCAGDRCSDRSAYVLLLGYYLGDGCIS